jgi:hypothetical protein
VNCDNASSFIKSCVCDCHTSHNNIAGCLLCDCKPVFGRDIYESRINELQKAISSLRDNIKKLLKIESEERICPVCNRSEWDYIGI